MKIGIFGTGYVGLVQATVLAEFGHEVICMDTDLHKINQLNLGIVPIYEIGLENLLKKNSLNGRLFFTTDAKYTVENSAVIFIAVGTPPTDDGFADLSFVLEVAKSIGTYIDSYKVIVNKSTVPVGTGKLVKSQIQRYSKNPSIQFDIVSNPEFMREGRALEDCLHPERIVIGTETSRPIKYMNWVYEKLIFSEVSFLYTDIETSEMIKYATNSFLAVKLSFINEMALLCEKVDASIIDVANAMGLDHRISPEFLSSGPGYGGSCFPKDTKALLNIAKDNDEELLVIDGAVRANEKQKEKMGCKIINNMNGVKGKVITLLGLTFKAETDDVRESPALDIIRGLVREGAFIKAYCPKGIKGAKLRLIDMDESVQYCSSAYDAAKGANALVIVTEWKEFKELNYKGIKDLMVECFLFDLRNLLISNENVTKAFKYYPVGVSPHYLQPVDVF